MSGQSMDKEYEQESAEIKKSQEAKETPYETSDFVENLKRELAAAQPPRLLGLRGLNQTWKRWSGIILPNLLFFGFFLFASLDSVVPHFAAEYGLPAVAQVTSRYTTQRKQTTYYYFGLSFKDSNNQPLSANVQVSEGYYQNPPADKNINIHYLSFFSSKPALDNCPLSSMNSGYIFIAIFVVIFLFQIYYLWLEYNVLKSGQLVHGKITDIYRGRNASTTVEYKWEEKTLKFSQQGVSGEIGDPAAVVLLPDAPSRARFFTPKRFPLFQVKKSKSSLFGI